MNDLKKVNLYKKGQSFLRKRYLENAKSIDKCQNQMNEEHVPEQADK